MRGPNGEPADATDDGRPTDDRPTTGAAGARGTRPGHGGRPPGGAAHGPDDGAADDGARAADGSSGWTDMWAQVIPAEEQARARALLGLALEGGAGTADAVREWAGADKPEKKAGRGGRRGSARARGPGVPEAGDGGVPGPDAGFDDGSAGADDGAGARGTAGRGRRGSRRGGRRRAGEDRPDWAAGPGGESWAAELPPDADAASGDDAGRYDESGHRGRRARRGGRGFGESGARGRIGPAQIDPDDDPEAAARAICLRQLTGQPRTRAQLADALHQRGVPDDVAERVLGRFTEVKLIDDAAFAAAWVDTRHTGRGLARRALARELRHRGVDPELVSEAVERLDPEQELETARALVARRLPGTRRLDRQVRMRRLAGMLARKGYGEGLALRVVREALDADEAEWREAEDAEGTAEDTWDYEPGPDEAP